ncbi:MAG: histidine kinase, partial [Bacteroidetes bacterium]|nr:histidine kinase [Bacteroidota bacterium]
MIYRSAFTMLFACLFNFCSGQRPQLYFRKISTQQGLSNNKVNCILQDKRNFIWIGTDDGLNRYDGNNFLVFRSTPGKNTGISGNIITALYEDSKQVLWIATADGGLSRYDYRLPVETQFIQYKNKSNDSNSIPTNIINDLLEDEKGYLWLASSGKRVIRFNKQTGAFDLPVTTGTTTALALCRDPQNNIWVGRQGGGILKIDPYSNRIDFDQRYTNLYAKLPHMVVTSLFLDADKNMWYGSWDKILYRYDFKTATEDAFGAQTNDGAFTGDEMSDFAEDNQQRLWMAGHYNGLHVFNKRTQQFYNYRFNAAAEGSIADDEITCLFIDREENLWVGSKKGISVSNLRQSFVQEFLPASTSHLMIYDFYTGDDKTLWIGTSEGLYKRPYGEKEFLHYPLTYHKEQLAITKIFRDETDGSIYLGSNYTLFGFDPASDNVKLLPDGAGDKVMDHIIESRIVSVIRDSIDNNPVLLASPYGHYLAYYDLVEKKWISRLDSSKKIISSFNMADNLIRKFHRGNDGRIWVAMTKEGLGAWKKSNTHPTLTYFKNIPEDPTSISCNRVSDICNAGNADLWVSTYG